VTDFPLIVIITVRLIPALSPDEKTLYFASRHATIGRSDLFKVQINDDGTFGIPENLGRPINTEGREAFLL
jgi:hypothetical protein